jgi:hypothetical protein
MGHARAQGLISLNKVSQSFGPIQISRFRKVQAIPGVLWQQTLRIVRQTGIQIQPQDIARDSKGLKLLI